MKQLRDMDIPYCWPCESCRVIYTPFGGNTTYCDIDKRPVDGHCPDRWREPGSDDE